MLSSKRSHALARKPAPPRAPGTPAPRPPPLPACEHASARATVASGRAVSRGRRRRRYSAAAAIRPLFLMSIRGPAIVSFTAPSLADAVDPAHLGAIVGAEVAGDVADGDE